MQTPKLSLQGKQSLKQTQSLMLSAKMQQSLHLLQLPILELTSAIEAEMEQNPVLEYAPEEEGEEPIEKERSSTEELNFEDKELMSLKQLNDLYQDEWKEPEQKGKEDDDRQNFLTNSLLFTPTLFEHLKAQAEEIFKEEKERFIAEAIIGNLNEHGFLDTPEEEIARATLSSLSEVEHVLKTIQTFDPFGVGARNLQESFLIQLTALGKKDSLAYRVVADNFDDLLHNRQQKLQKCLKATPQKIKEAIQVLSKLSFHPGGHFLEKDPQAIVPDIFIWQEKDHLRVEINERLIPELRLNHTYFKMIEQEDTPEETKQYLKRKILSAKWLFQNIQQRNTTLEKIADALVKTQQEFLSDPIGQLKPVTMKGLAEEVGVHESTIARSVQGKYLFCPRGLLPLRSFFSHGYATEKGEEVSSNTVLTLLKEIIDQEDKQKPLSDESLKQCLNEKGIPCARRTIAKYRSLLHLGNAHQRKQF